MEDQNLRPSSPQPCAKHGVHAQVMHAMRLRVLHTSKYVKPSGGEVAASITTHTGTKNEIEYADSGHHNACKRFATCTNDVRTPMQECAYSCS